MRRPVAALLTAAILLLAGPALAQRGPGNEVAPVTVPPPNGPVATLAASYPAAGAAVAGGVLVLKASFDQPMAPDSFAVAAAEGGEPLDCLKDARLLADGKTFVLLCRTRLAKSYAVALKARGAGGKPAAPVTLSFTTTDAAPVNNIRAAMKTSGLADTDMPVVDTPILASGGQ